MSKAADGYGRRTWPGAARLFIVDVTYGGLVGMVGMAYESRSDVYDESKRYWIGLLGSGQKASSLKTR